MAGDGWKVAERHAGVRAAARTPARGHLVFEALDLGEVVDELGLLLGGDDHDELRVRLVGRDGEGPELAGAGDDGVPVADVVAVHVSQTYTP